MEVDQALLGEALEAALVEATSLLGAFWEEEVVEEVKTIFQEVEVQ